MGVTVPKLLDRQQVCEALGCRPSKLDQMRRNGSFPPGRRVGGRHVRWTTDDVANWIRRLPTAKVGGR